MPGASDRQRWHAFRECIVHEFIHKRASFFPIARLMIHGVVLAQHGDARSHSLHAATELDWGQEVWSFASMGLLLQELYVSPELMTDDRWDVLAEALKWIRINSYTLEDMRWVFSAGCIEGTMEPHGWAAWRGSRGFITLRNSRMDIAQTSTDFTLASALELPLAARRGPGDVSRSFIVSVEKRLAGTDLPETRAGKLCAFLVGSKESDDASGCILSADQTTHVKLGWGELLILQVTMLPLQK